MFVYVSVRVCTVEIIKNHKHHFYFLTSLLLARVFIAFFTQYFFSCPPIEIKLTRHLFFFFSFLFSFYTNMSQNNNPKAQQTFYDLDIARCNEKWVDIPELARRYKKYHPYESGTKFF